MLKLVGKLDLVPSEGLKNRINEIKIGFLEIIKESLGHPGHPSRIECFQVFQRIFVADFQKMLKSGKYGLKPWLNPSMQSSGGGWWGGLWKCVNTTWNGRVKIF